MTLRGIIFGLIACNFILLSLKIQSTESAAYYGFFFDEDVARSIKAVTDSYFTTSLQTIPDFKTFLESASHNSNVSDILNYYTKPLDPSNQAFDPLYHITTKYCGEDANCISSYEDSVSSSFNKVFPMQLIGYFFTNKTFGIRIQFTPDQEALFDNDRHSSKNYPNRSLTGSINLEFNLQPRQTYSGLTFEPQVLDLKPTNNTPHITVGCAPGVSAEVTGTDLSDIINFEATFSESMFANYSIDDGHYGALVIQYEKDSDAFVIYPMVKILANATFRPSEASDGSDGIAIIGSLTSVVIFSIMSVSTVILS